MSNDKTTLADVQPGGRVRLVDQTPFVFARFVNGVRMAEGVTIEKERNLTDAMKVAAKVASKGPNGEVPVLVHVAVLSAQPSPGGQDALDCIGRIEEAIEFRVPHDIYAAVHGELAELKAALVARQPVRIYGCCAQPEGELHTAECPNLRHLAARQPVGESITVEAVATVRRNSDGDSYIDWLTEGGIADLEVGDVLMVSDRTITDEDGSGEVYAAQPAQAVDLWQPIETAPKNGSSMLLGHFNSAGNWRTVRGRWFSAEKIEMEWENADDFESGWYEESVEADDIPNVWPTTPTHWQLLPAAPSVDSQAVGNG
ncbi:TPA: hypothetical protein UM521_000346 [Stenotrophomonas maltophilia]|nr:hypothetical protein [Stenotrophomonas maltophilia]HEL4214036.1 hypothetical protein [Stenotrophomonas maltophilia]HEL4269982.1 hypothetical protein [Stenotrophomonas maltophilia]HEL4301153.1 hypothetical protein [Stenotrophomonas maltophilia]HEL4813990.1 hypothetical protein [Stenotrophomonas maltophilia]